MRQELSPIQEAAIDKLWREDISVGGAPERYESPAACCRIVEDKMYNGMSFKTAVMRMLAEVPRPDDPKARRQHVQDVLLKRIKEMQRARVEAYSSKKLEPWRTK